MLDPAWLMRIDAVRCKGAAAARMEKQEWRGGSNRSAQDAARRVVDEANPLRTTPHRGTVRRAVTHASRSRFARECGEVERGRLTSAAVVSVVTTLFEEASAAAPPPSLGAKWGNQQPGPLSPVTRSTQPEQAVGASRRVRERGVKSAAAESRVRRGTVGRLDPCQLDAAPSCSGCGRGESQRPGLDQALANGRSAPSCLSRASRSRCSVIGTATSFCGRSMIIIL